MVSLYFLVIALVVLGATILLWNWLGQWRESQWRDQDGRTSPSLEAFRRHSGDLLNAIQDPDVIAWQLFSKRVISDTLVEEICYPMIPPVQKKTRLLAAVRGHIAVSPAGLDTFLQVLRMQPYLMDMAQVLEDTYNECKTNPSTTSRGSGLQPKFEWPIVLSRLWPTSRSSPVDIYASYLKSWYLRQKFPTYGKLPHSPSKKYICLASVKKERVSMEKANAFTRATIRGDIDDVYNAKEPIGMEDIAIVRDGVWPKCVLVEGAPGIGKTTFAWKMCRKWGKGKILSNYSLVVLLSLREKKFREASCISDLFHFYDADLQEQVVHEVTKSGGKGVLLLFDGYDELPTELRTMNSIFLDVIRGRVLPQATVLITSRPSASGFLYEECNDYMSQHIEIVGFTSEKVQSYLESTCGSDPTLLSGIQEYLQCYPHVRRMMYVPLNAAIVVEVYRTSKKDENVIPKTMTQLYGCLVRSMLRRYLNDHPVYGRQKWRIRAFADLPPDVHKQLCEVGGIAYERIKNDQQLIFDDLPEDFDSLGLMQCVPELYVDEGAAVSHSFLHLTVQEFMAAFHLSQCPVEQQDEQFNCRAPNVKMVLRFLAGLTGLAGIKAGRPIMCDFRFSLDFIYWIFEAQKGVVGVILFQFCAGIFTTELTMFDFYVLGYCIAHSDCGWVIDLTGCGVEDFGLAQLVLGILESPTSSHGHILALTLSDDYITDGIKFLLELPPSMLGTLMELDLTANAIGDVETASLIRRLRIPLDINLSFTSIGVECCRALGELMSSCSTLVKLDISENKLPPEAVGQIISGLHQNTGLKILRIGESRFSLDNCISLAIALRTNHTLTKLLAFSCGIGPEGAKHLAGALSENVTLQELYLSDNPIGVTGATAFAEALTINGSLKKLDIDDDSAGVEGTRKLLDSLYQNDAMKALLLSSEYKAVISSEEYDSIRSAGRVCWNILEFECVELWDKNAEEDSGSDDDELSDAVSEDECVLPQPYL